MGAIGAWAAATSSMKENGRRERRVDRVGRAPGADGALRVGEELLRGHGANVRGCVPDLEQLLGLVAGEELDRLRLGLASLGLSHRLDDVPAEHVGGVAGAAGGAPRGGRGRSDRSDDGGRGGARTGERGDGVNAARHGGEPDASSRGGHHRCLSTSANRARTDHHGRARTDGTAAHTTVRIERESRAPLDRRMTRCAVRWARAHPSRLPFIHRRSGCFIVTRRHALRANHPTNARARSGERPARFRALVASPPGFRQVRPAAPATSARVSRRGARARASLQASPRDVIFPAGRPLPAASRSASRSVVPSDDIP